MQCESQVTISKVSSKNFNEEKKTSESETQVYYKLLNYS